MSGPSEHDKWSAGDAYELYMGRWSRRLSDQFLNWLNIPPEADWVDVGCGTGALCAAILASRSPKSVHGIDTSEGFIQHASQTITDPRARFSVGSAGTLPLKDDSIDCAVSALALNFMPDRVGALQELGRVVRPDGDIAAYVWDYPGGGMGFIDVFWKAAAKLDPAAAELDESTRFPFATSEGLHADFSQAGLRDCTVEAIEVRTVFSDFETFWHPITLGVGPAPGYLASLPVAEAEQLKSLVADMVGDGVIDLPARAWAARAANRG